MAGFSLGTNKKIKNSIFQRNPSIIPLDDIFACPICCTNFRPNHKIKQCREGHSICERCFGLVTDCPICRCAFLGTRNLIMEKLVNALHDIDPKVIANSFVAIREKTEDPKKDGETQNLIWIPSGKSSLPTNAVLASYNKQGHPLYIGRVTHENALIPGKVNPRQKLCYFPADGEEKCSENYEVLVSTNESMENCWISCSDGDVPNNAFPAGRSADGEVLYVGRAFHDGVLTHGKVQPSEGACFLPFYDEEVKCRTYEVFVDVTRRKGDEEAAGSSIKEDDSFEICE
ncbi:uncharacterized protein LOC134838414 [Culicoides brevitarsis]|uniref:uncharacterized protein LOC134838414 n=1 Tax=Culicoides brevitarsis TaxID=469753 RepID=UPI00307BDD58